MEGGRRERLRAEGASEGRQESGGMQGGSEHGRSEEDMIIMDLRYRRL